MDLLTSSSPHLGRTENLGGAEPTPSPKMGESPSPVPTGLHTRLSQPSTAAPYSCIFKL